MGIVGTVIALTRFPVKSMAGESADALELRWTGLHGDRQYGFVRLDDRGRFPWLTARDHPAMVLYRPRYADPQDPRHAAVSVLAPDGETLAVADPALARRLSPAPVAMLQVGRGIFDAMPVSLITTRQLAEIDAAHGARLDARRFRINIVIDSNADMAAWAGRRLALGGASLLVNQPIPRCSMVTICPDSANRDATVMRTVATVFDNAIGLYAATATPGPIRLGDQVRLLE